MNGVAIDAHQHFWQPARGDYGWLTADLEPLYRDFLPADLAPLMQRAGVARTIVVQAAPTVAETRFLLGLARETSWIAGVVGWVDFAAADAVDTLCGLARDPLFLGVRPMVQDIPDPDWMLDAQLVPVFEALETLELSFDALVRPVHLPRLRRLVERHPALRVVVDHAAKPEIADGRFDGWAEDLAGLAREGQATCKLSGLVTEARADWHTDDLRRYADHLFATFGTGRLMWGSDWPVVELAGGYRAWADATGLLLDGLGGEERDHVLGDVARKFYRLDDRAPERASPAEEERNT